MDTAIVTGTTQGLLDDIKDYQEHQFVLQARSFLKSGGDPINYYAAIAKSLPQVPGVENAVAMQLLLSAEMTLINLVNGMLTASSEERKAGNSKATKPADLYRKYQSTLRAITARRAESDLFASELLADLYLEQSLSNGDLESPDYVDAYTGQSLFEIENIDTFVSEELHRATSASEGEALLLQAIFWEKNDGFTGAAPIMPVSGFELELQRQAERCRIDLKWGDAEVAAFLKANRVGVSMTEEPELPEDDRGFVPPPLVKDLKLDGETIRNAYPATKEFNKARSETFNWMSSKTAVLKDGKAKLVRRVTGDWHGTFRSIFTETFAFKEMIAAIEKSTTDQYGNPAPESAAAVYLRVSGEYGVMPQDIEHIKVDHPCGTLLTFVIDFFEDILELMGDSALFSSSEIAAYGKIDSSDTDYLKRVVDTMPEYDPNAVKTRSWNMAFTEAVTGGAEWKTAEASAWSAWRFAMSEKAAQAYNSVIQQSGTQRAAMSAFWKLAPVKVPRPQAKIEAVLANRQGLKLEGGREINWYVAKLKIKNNELDLSDDIKPRLLAKLVELNCGHEVHDLLV